MADTFLTGRRARRAQVFGSTAKRKGAGWTRKFRKGREQRLPFNEAPKETDHADRP